MKQKHLIAINKVDLVENEELGQLINKIRDALGQQKAKIKKSLWLHGIYKNYIIARDFETGAFFKMDMKRDGEDVVLSNMQEVVMQFLPKKDAVEKSEDAAADNFKVVELPTMLVTVQDGKLTDASLEAIREVTKAAPAEEVTKFVEPPKNSFWGGVLD